MRDSGDAWVEGPGGIRRWGVYGAAGVLVLDPSRGVLLQHRAEWSHFGGTWALPGGARHEGESAVDGALREAAEEAAVPRDAVRLRSAIVLDLGFWSYTTVIVDVVRPFEAAVADPESIELRWVPVDEVDALPLHPSFAEAWPQLRGLIAERSVVVVDVANVVGSRPDGWWRDRAGATAALLRRIEGAGAEPVRSEPAAASADAGTKVSSSAPESGGGDANEARAGVRADVPAVLRWPRVIAVVEGQAAGVAEAWEPNGPELVPPVEVVAAENDGDQAIVQVVAGLAGAGNAGAAEASGAGVSPASTITVVTADRELVSRVTVLGATTMGPGAFLAAID